jgi:hypothetical protein
MNCIDKSVPERVCVLFFLEKVVNLLVDFGLLPKPVNFSLVAIWRRYLLISISCHRGCLFLTL